MFAGKNKKWTDTRVIKCGRVSINENFSIFSVSEKFVYGIVNEHKTFKTVSCISASKLKINERIPGTIK